MSAARSLIRGCQTRERANLARKTFVWLAIMAFLLGALAAARYVYLRLETVPAA